LLGISSIFYKDVKTVNFKKKGLTVGWLFFNMVGNVDSARV
jgi:hypothetical protein